MQRTGVFAGRDDLILIVGYDYDGYFDLRVSLADNPQTVVQTCFVFEICLDLFSAEPQRADHFDVTIRRWLWVKGLRETSPEQASTGDRFAKIETQVPNERRFDRGP